MGASAKEQLRQGLITFLRVWGFAYPSRVLVLMDSDTGKRRNIDNFKMSLGIKQGYIQKKESDQKLHLSKKGNAKTQDPGKIDSDSPAQQLKAALKEKLTAKADNRDQAILSKSNKPKESSSPAEETELKDLKGEFDTEKGITTATDLKTYEDYLIAGKAETFFRARKPVDIFPMIVLAVFLPILILTEAWQIAIIYNISVDPVIYAAAGTALIMLTIHNARFAYGSGMEVLFATKKTTAGGSNVYIPNMLEFLNFKQSRIQDLRDDLLASAYSEIKPLRMRCVQLEAKVERFYNGFDKAKAEGEREGLTFGGHGIKAIAPYWAIILVFAVGIIFGWVLSGGVNLWQPVNATAINGSIPAQPLH